MKNLLKLKLFAALMLSVPVFAVDDIAVIDMRTAVLSTQAAADAFKALEEDADYAANLEEAQSLQAERQAIAEKLQKELETLSQEEIAEMQKIIGELIQAKQIKVLLQKNETILFSDPAMDLTDDVTSMLDVAASEANTQSE